jgi:hypothetical protein
MKEKTLRIFVPGIFSALAVLLAIACTERSPRTSAEVSLEFNFAATRGPGSAAGMDCFLVNVKGAGVVATYPLVDFGDGVTSSCLDLGTVSAAFSLSDATTSGIRLQVKTGTARTIEVLGFEGLGTCAGKSLKELLDTDDAELYTLGSTTTDISSNRTIAIENSYVSGTTEDKVEECEEAGSSGGGSGLARVYRYYGGSYYDLGLRATSINALHVSGGNLFIGGDFSDAGNNTNADNFAVYDIAGHTFAGFAPLSGPVRAITNIGGNVYVGGSFLDASGNDFADRIARWDGTLWSGLGSGVNNGQVNALEALGGFVYVGGTFSSADGNSTLDSLATWADTGNSWGQVAPSAPMGAGKEVRALKGAAPYLFIGGNFVNAGGNDDADNIALYAGGSIIQAPGAGAALNGAVNALGMISGSEFYATGSFTNAGGNPNADGIAQFITGNWAPLGTGFSGTGYALATFGTDYYLGGAFSNVGAVLNTANIAQFNGSSWQSVGMGLNGAVKAIATDGTNYFVGGDFNATGAGLVPVVTMQPVSPLQKPIESKFSGQ